ncbi:MAG TPA: 2TM domain-containing protein [Acidimicrobiales bacterium]|nr:2TM domain-containing protein [Acidimicrobiales bacterium]
MPEILEKTPSETETEAGRPTEDDRRRQEAIKQIERRRHFRVELAASALAIVLLVVIWATSEYHNAGGWPTHGFSQSSGIHDVWNYWIVYPVVGILLILGARAWFVYGHRPISESEIQREVERQTQRR